MIDLKNLFGEHPDCANDATLFRSLLNDLYPEEKAKTDVLVTIVSCGIGLEIQNGKNDDLSLRSFAKRMENEYGFASSLCEECLHLWRSASEPLPLRQDSVGKPASQGLQIENGVLLGVGSCTEQDIIIPDGVISIGERAFAGCDFLRTIIIPNGVTKIGNAAFDGCVSLTSITIPESVTQIGESDLDEIDPENISFHIVDHGGQVFRNCKKLKGVYITDIGKWCGISFHDSDSNPLGYAKNLYLCGKLVTDLRIPDGITSIGRHAFFGCDTLTSVTIPKSVTEINVGAFSCCASLPSVTIPHGVKTIGDEAFIYCDALTSINIPASVVYVGDGAFCNCEALRSVTIENGIMSIGDEAFCECTALTNVVIGAGVLSIGERAFYKCSALTSITYTGTKAQWKRISKGERWNASTGTYTIRCTNGKIKNME